MFYGLRHTEHQYFWNADDSWIFSEHSGLNDKGLAGSGKNSYLVGLLLAIPRSAQCNFRAVNWPLVCAAAMWPMHSVRKRKNSRNKIFPAQSRILVEWCFRRSCCSWNGASFELFCNTVTTLQGDIRNLNFLDDFLEFFCLQQSCKAAHFTYLCRRHQNCSSSPFRDICLFE